MLGEQVRKSLRRFRNVHCRRRSTRCIHADITLYTYRTFQNGEGKYDRSLDTAPPRSFIESLPTLGIPRPCGRRDSVSFSCSPPSTSTSHHHPRAPHPIVILVVDIKHWRAVLHTRHAIVRRWDLIRHLHLHHRIIIEAVLWLVGHRGLVVGERHRWGSVLHRCHGCQIA